MEYADCYPALNHAKKSALFFDERTHYANPPGDSFGWPNASIVYLDRPKEWQGDGSMGQAPRRHGIFFEDELEGLQRAKLKSAKNVSDTSSPRE